MHLLADGAIVTTFQEIEAKIRFVKSGVSFAKSQSKYMDSRSNDAKDYAVVALSKIDVGASTLTAEQKKQFMTSLATARGQQELQDYVTYLRSTAKIKEVVEKK